MLSRQTYVSPDALDTMGREELLRKKLDAETRLADIKGQIEKAEAEFHLTGKYADPDWYRRAKGAKRYAAIDLHEINTRLSELRKVEKAANVQRHAVAVKTKHVAFLHAFYRAAKAELTPEVFEALIELAHEQVDAGTAYDCSMCAEATAANDGQP